jgi:hypothetical protein
MKTLKGISALICLFAFASICRAQDVKAPPDLPDFSGTWILDRKKSEVTFTDKNQRDAYTSLTIVQKGLTMTIAEKTYSGTETVETSKEIIADGRKMPWRKNVTIDKNNFVSYRWKGKKLIKEMEFVVVKENGSNDDLNWGGKKSAKMRSTEEWEISKDGKTLTQIISPAVMPAFRPLPFALTMKNIYRRKI